MRTFALLLVLLIALGALATMQYHTISLLSMAREEHARDAVDYASRRFADDLDRDISRMVRAFREAPPDPFPLVQRANEEHLAGAIYMADMGRSEEGSLFKLDRANFRFEPVPWSPTLAEVMSPAAIVLPTRPDPRFGPPHHSMLIIQVSQPVLTREVFPQLAQRWLKGYDLAVTAGDRIVWRSGTWNGEGPEAVQPLPVLHPAHPDERVGWKLLVRHHGAPLAQLIASARRRNLLISAAVLLLFASSAIMLAVLLRRAERLRVQQLEFVAGITHELNTPLAVVTSAGQNLADGVVHDEAQVRRYGEAIVDESRRLSDTVAQVLQFAGMGRSVAPRNEPVDVRAIVEDAVARCRWLAEERPVSVETEIADDLPAVAGDPAALTRAVQNLIANAIRHGGDGGVVHVRAERDDGGIAITVEDQGRGIAARDLPHLFEPFYRGRDAGSTRGSGLGLTIVQQIAKAHGGSVTVARRRERGAAFTLHLSTAHA